MTARVSLAILLISSVALAGCLAWTEDSQGNLRSVGLPGVPLWQSKQPPPVMTPSDFGLTPQQAAQYSGPILVIPNPNGSAMYKFYSGQNGCADDLKAMMAQRAQSNQNGPAPYCAPPPGPAAAQQGSKS
ncbi:MAG TPA: hypothetical protein VFB15_08485 [Candidatus Binataceae bacterium]|nr:hypothetical protein [Candidatus Binataceae bacterium]